MISRITETKNNDVFLRCKFGSSIYKGNTRATIFNSIQERRSNGFKKRLTHSDSLEVFICCDSWR